MYAEVAWVLVSSGTQVQPQTIVDPDYLPYYLSVSYDYDSKKFYDENLDHGWGPSASLNYTADICTGVAVNKGSSFIMY